MFTDFSYQDYPYPARRNVIFAKEGMVATSQPLAARAGLQILEKGGNAIDAAVATAACLTVVNPASNGLGSDAFAIIWHEGKLYGMNGSGRSPGSLTLEALKEKGYEEMPSYGWEPVTVPGAPGVWAELNKKLGSLPLSEVLAPAIGYAEEGYPVPPSLGQSWQRAAEHYKKELQGDEFAGWFATFAPQGKAPAAGDVWNSPGHAATLQAIAATNAEAFYRGRIAEEIASFARKTGGYLTAEDLAGYSPEWVEPVNVDYRGYQVWELPPNGQGMVALMALNILKGFSFACRDRVETFHKQIEAIKLAFADGRKYITDPDKMSVAVADLLAEDYAEQRRGLITEKALEPEPGRPPGGGTVYLAAADSKGSMVSFIQSNYMGFGSGIVIPGTGIALQNRGKSFSLDRKEANCLEPGKRPYHTIIPGFLTRGGTPLGPFGVMGGYMQPQGHLQVVMNMIDFALNPQAALDAPRWYWEEGRQIVVEPGFPLAIARQLERRGHRVRIALNSGIFGRGQVILRNPRTGVLVGGTESRSDGYIAVR